MAYKTRAALPDLTAEQIEQLQEWIIRKDTIDDFSWRGFHEDGRRTALKGTMRYAQQAILDQEFVCPNWPHCEHNDAQHCARSWAQQQERERQETRRLGRRKYGYAA